MIKKAIIFICAVIIFFAAVMLTPVSGLISYRLASRITASFGQEYENTDFSRLLNLSGFFNLEKYSAMQSPEYIIAELPPPDDSPDNIRIYSDGSIMSIRGTHEHYADFGCFVEPVIIEEVSATNLEIPVGKFRITPRNFSGQNTGTARLLMNNETNLNINITDFLNRPFPVSPFDISRQDEPIVLIIHTHATESLVDDGVFYYYPPFTAERTQDINRNIVLIGAALKNKLREYHIPVVQSELIHDYPSFRDSYRRSLETINYYIEKYPSIRYVIDVHRDSIIAETGEKFKPTVNINGLDTAQVMIVTGTNAGGAYHPDWRDNLTFSAQLQHKMNTLYPMLARPINLRPVRFNQHATKGSIILEIGSCGSTFSEAIRAAELVGECLARLILENN